MRVANLHVGRAGNHQSITAILIPNLFDFLFDGLDSFIPAHGHEFAATALAYTLERRLDALAAIHMLYFGNTTHANSRITLLQRIVGFHLAQTPVAHRTFQRAVTRAMVLVKRVCHVLFGLCVRLCRRQPAACAGHASGTG